LLGSGFGLWLEQMMMEEIVSKREQFFPCLQTTGFGGGSLGLSQSGIYLQMQADI